MPTNSPDPRNQNFARCHHAWAKQRDCLDTYFRVQSDSVVLFVLFVFSVVFCLLCCWIHHSADTPLSAVVNSSKSAPRFLQLSSFIPSLLQGLVCGEKEKSQVSERPGEAIFSKLFQEKRRKLWLLQNTHAWQFQARSPQASSNKNTRQSFLIS